MAYYTCIGNKVNDDHKSEYQQTYRWIRMRGIIGLLSLMFSVGLLYKNEVWTVVRQELYDSVSKGVVELDNRGGVDPANEGKIVFLQGRIQVNEPLTEPEYGVTIGAVKLKRRVQMYQWVELHRQPSSWWEVQVEEGPLVSYSTTWKDRLVDSSVFVRPFGHANPKTFPVESGVTVSDVVRVGSHTLSGELKEHFTTFTLLTSDQRPERRDIKMHSGLYYHSFDVWSPEVGDTRVQLSYAGAADDLVTILARQVGGMLQPFYVENRDLTAVLEGQHSLSDVLATRFPSSGIWLIRIPAYFAVYCAYSSLLSVFCNRGKSSRLTHVFVSNSKSLLCHVFSAVTLMVVMALTWFRYSLLLGSLNLLAALMLIFYCLSKGYSLYYYFNR